MAKRVVVGLSGGVDSSVTAHLLVEQGYEVIGMFMRNWVDDSVIISEECPWVEDSNDALAVAEKLGIPFHVIDLSEQYKERIVDYMFAEYERGRTPNPDILCNREVKFDIFLKAALKLKADYVATGHYCQKETIVENGKEIHRLLAGADANKDQSYFLCQLSQEQLAKALFPIGHLQKPEVRAIAKEADLITADKKDSQGLCFIGKVRLPDFLQQQLSPKKGEIRELAPNSTNFNTFLEKRVSHFDTKLEELKHLTQPYEYAPTDGKLVGEHSGAHYYTIGQRKGLGVGGTPEPLFVIEKDTKENVIYTGQGENHPGLLRKGLFVPSEQVHWVRPDLALKSGESRTYDSRIRYRQELDKAELFMEEDGLYVIFENYQKGIAPGQFVAWYDKNELIGSGEIQ
ncbi:tRNA 2-thiouridine(34) synthase MnmA [Roseivirga echinicomitans]|uniref:tRNA-specific 2-thiouridylase MnmA n=1 Tax=Roseivirga echinicomitans TaxID=296218 RepID=A0A150X2Q3_9BACT|nr:tRNA 2-thiouridine(34) synthase MnmA [Roseivirga echinicomitans]KYG72996.1 tRNA(5-methylaminomethyl-2-thiouridylate)-methyltransferase [Roseivirga echinicomitans]